MGVNLQGGSDDPVDQSRLGDPGGRRLMEKDGGGRHPGERVGFQDGNPSVCSYEHVDPGISLQVEGAKCLYRRLTDSLEPIGGGAPPRPVFSLAVKEIIVLGGG